MAKLQIPYNQAKKKFRMAEIPNLQKEIARLKDTLTQTGNPDEKRAIKAQIDALNIKIKSFRQSDPVKDESVEEDAQGAITMGNVGSPTMATGEPAKGGSSALYYPKVGPMMSRRGDIKSKKKKKKIREFNEFYFSENEDEKVAWDKVYDLVLFNIKRGRKMWDIVQPVIKFASEWGLDIDDDDVLSLYNKAIKEVGRSTDI